ncbi:hypothetical protein QBC43DRAFT_296437 [Cladorrhinum sp. PSN259]|nr:hypothetical protein QBC43DRAFT_296437 [Cladorrhinum sp. PSN259]
MVEHNDNVGGGGVGGDTNNFISTPGQATASFKSPLTDNNNKSPTDFPGAIITIVLVISLVCACCLGVLMIWLHKRRTASKARVYRTVALTGEIVVMSDDGSPRNSREGVDREDDDEGNGRGCNSEKSPRKLRKRGGNAGGMSGGGGWPSEVSVSKGMLDACGGIDEGPMGKPIRHMSMPLGILGTKMGGGWFGGMLGHARSRSDIPQQACGLERGFSNREKPGWLDDDVLHGPSRRTGSGLPLWRKGDDKVRNNSMMMLPSLPGVHHSVHGYPYLSWDGGPGSAAGSEEALLGSDRVTGYGNLRAFSREVPQIPRMALIKQGNLVRSATRASLAGYQRVDGGLQQQQQIQRAGTVPSHAGSPSGTPMRALPSTPSRRHVRSESADTILTEILRSTEKRLRSGSVGAIASNTGHVRKRSASRLGQRTVSRSRTPSPRKILPVPPSTPGHNRQESEISAVSADSFLADPEGMLDSPSGLTSPNRSTKREGERQLQVHSVRSSTSSSLSTVLSEDEMPEEVRKAIMPLDGFVVEPQRAINIKPPVYNDPFVTAPAPLFNSRPKASHGWPPKQQDSNSRRMTLGPHSSHLSGELILAPGPGRYSLKAHPLPKTPTLTMDELLGVPFLPNAPPPSPASSPSPSGSPSSRRKSRGPTGPLFLRLTKTSTLSNIPALPPPAAPGITALASERRKTMSPTKTVQFTDRLEPEDLPALPDSPTRRPGGKRAIKTATKKQKHESVTSSIYSQVSSPPHAPSSPIDIGRIGKEKASLIKSLNESAISANSCISAMERKGGRREEEEEEEESLEDKIPGITSTIMSLRRMNSQMSTASSLMSTVPDRSLSSSPLRVLSGLGKKRVSLPHHNNNNNLEQASSPSRIREVRKSMGSRNYLAVGHKRGKSASAISGGSINDSPGGGGRDTPPRPSKKRKPATVGSGIGANVGRRVPGGSRAKRLSVASSVGSIEERLEREKQRVSRMISVDVDGNVLDREKENVTEVVELQVPAGEFTFQICDDEEQEETGTEEDGEKGGLKMRFPWDLSGGSIRRVGGYGGNNNNNSPSRGSVRSVDSLRLYDGQGFLIPGIASPVRCRSPGKLRV